MRIITEQKDLDFIVSRLESHRRRVDYACLKQDESHYNVADRSSALYGAQLRSLFEPLVIPDFFSPQEIELLLQQKEQQDIKANSGHRPGVSEKKQGWGEVEQALIGPRLQSALGVSDVLAGTYHDLKRPYTVHADLGKDLNLFSYANILIPLKMDPANTNTEIIFFDQRYFGFSANFYCSSTMNSRIQGYNLNVFDKAGVCGLTGTAFDKSLKEKYLSHCHDGDLDGLSLMKAIPWVPGSLIAFDPTHIHASANFTKQGITQKTALTLSLGVSVQI